MLATMPAQATSARIQLGHCPSAPFSMGVRAAAEQLERVVQGGEGLALLAAEAEDQAAPDEEPAEGDDERGDAAVGDDEPGDAAAQRHRARRRTRWR